jgi:phenylacetate-coenzyme A ligase PaaK-like adenylate-forming protein
MQHNPQETFVEALERADGRRELVVTMLNPRRRLPLIRYNTGDVIDYLPYRRVEEILGDFRCPAHLPPLPLPVGLTWGRLQPLKTAGGKLIYPEQVKEALYAAEPAAEAATGSFRLSDGAAGPTLRVQLREGKDAPAGAAEALAAQVARFADAHVTVEMIPHERFPDALAQDFERKNRYV